MAGILPIIILLVLGIGIFILYRRRVRQKQENKPSRGIVRFMDAFLDFCWIMQWIVVLSILIGYFVVIFNKEVITDVAGAPIFISAVSVFIRAVLFLFILFYLRQFVKTLLTGNPFLEANARRLRTIAFFTIGYTVLDVVSKLFQSYWISRAMEKPILNNPVSIRFEFIILGLMILVIAEVFRIGVGMREEQSLTI